jgi:hypothetical protein
MGPVPAPGTSNVVRVDVARVAVASFSCVHAADNPKSARAQRAASPLPIGRAFLCKPDNIVKIAVFISALLTGQMARATLSLTR